MCYVITNETVNAHLACRSTIIDLFFLRSCIVESFNIHLLLLFVAAVCSSDGVIWRLFPKQNSLDGIEMPPATHGFWSVADCLSACASNVNCLAVDYNTVTSRCYQFTNSNFASSRGSYPDVNQFVAERCVPGMQITSAPHAFLTNKPRKCVIGKYIANYFCAMCVIS
jgi:PAN domain